MKKIIAADSLGIDLRKDLAGSILTLQIVKRTEVLLGESLPGTRFEAAEITAEGREIRKIRKCAERTGSWVRFIKTGKDTSLMITPSVKIAGEEVGPLKKEELLSRLKEAEEVQKKKSEKDRKGEKKHADVSRNR